MKETFYFSHDYNARSDPKIIKLIMKYGMEGYGIYWSIIETLYEQDGFALRSDYECIAFALRMDCDRIKEIIEKSGLFKVENEKFFSESVLRRLKTRDLKSSKTRASALKRWSKDDANALRSESEGNAIKESKVKESIEKEEEKDISLSEEEIKKQEAEEYEKWRIENDKKNAEFMERERLREEEANKQYPI